MCAGRLEERIIWRDLIESSRIEQRRMEIASVGKGKVRNEPRQLANVCHRTLHSHVGQNLFRSPLIWRVNDHRIAIFHSEGKQTHVSAPNNSGSCSGLGFKHRVHSLNHVTSEPFSGPSQQSIYEYLTELMTTVQNKSNPLSGRSLSNHIVATARDGQAVHQLPIRPDPDQVR